MLSLLVPCTFSFSHLNVVHLPPAHVAGCCLSFSPAPGNMILLSFIRFRGHNEGGEHLGITTVFQASGGCCARGAEQRPM